MGNNEPNYKENLIFLKENTKNHNLIKKLNDKITQLKLQNESYWDKIDDLLKDIEILYDELLRNCPEKEQWLIKNFPYVKDKIYPDEEN